MPGEYVPNYLIFVSEAALFAIPFDEDRLELVGERIRVLDGIPVTGPGRAPFSASTEGMLATRSFRPPVCRDAR